jgi:UDP-GlcNAc:undecaprenyl-phosphate/decaprenyl-phosphate GlcNAc-1-phosphate transferase
VIILGLVHTERQWTVVAVGAVFALVLMVLTLGRPVRVRQQIRRGESL